MPELILPGGYLCQYDSEDQSLIRQYHWRMHSEGYACTTINGKMVLMHRLIMKVLDRPEVEVDHRFHNKLDNRKSMLRICTPAENRRNSRKLKQTAHSKFKGIYLDENRWHCQIMQEGKVKNLGRSSNEIMAAKLYDQRALELFRDFACINFLSSREARQLTLFPWV